MQSKLYLNSMGRMFGVEAFLSNTVKHTAKQMIEAVVVVVVAVEIILIIEAMIEAIMAEIMVVVATAAVATAVVLVVAITITVVTVAMTTMIITHHKEAIHTEHIHLVVSVATHTMSLTTVLMLSVIRFMRGIDTTHKAVIHRRATHLLYTPMTVEDEVMVVETVEIVEETAETEAIVEIGVIVGIDTQVDHIEAAQINITLMKKSRLFPLLKIHYIEVEEVEVEVINTKTNTRYKIQLRSEIIFEEIIVFYVVIVTNRYPYVVHF